MATQQIGYSDTLSFLMGIPDPLLSIDLAVRPAYCAWALNFRFACM